VVTRLGLLHYTVNVNGNHRKCHINQMRRSSCEGGGDDYDEQKTTQPATTSQPEILVESVQPTKHHEVQNYQPTHDDTAEYF
jgi:hypothetical protein